MSSRSKVVVVEKKDLRRLMSENKGFIARNESKIESRFSKYPFGCYDSHRTLRWAFIKCEVRNCESAKSSHV